MTPDRTHDLQSASATSRRTFIKRAAGVAAGLSVPGLLAACGTTEPVATGGGGAARARAPAGSRWRARITR